MKAKLRIYYFLLLLVAVFAFCRTSAQLSIRFSPAVSGQSLHGLTNVSIVNSYPQDLHGALSVTVSTTDGMQVVQFHTTSFIIRRGAAEISRSAFASGRYKFSSNYYGSLLSQTGRFSEGEFEYCFEIELGDSKPADVPLYFEQCFSYSVQPMTPLLLIDPVDGDETCNRRPGFLWQLPAPMPAGSRSRLQLVELPGGRDAAEALAFDLPLINQGNIPGNTLSFPPGVRELREGAQYAWQVTVYNGTTILKKSEIWIFKVTCDKPLPPVLEGDSYREMKETNDGHFYFTDGWLRFSFINPYSGGDLSYNITAADKPAESLKKLPPLKLLPGLNKYAIDISGNNEFKDGKEYLLIVTLAGNRHLRLRFIYKT